MDSSLATESARVTQADVPVYGSDVSYRAFRRLAAHVDLRPEELVALNSLPVRYRRFAAGEMVYLDGDRCDVAYLLEDGWAHRYAVLADGRRQIFNFALPGEILGLQHCLLGAPQQAVQALTDCTVAALPAARLRQTISRHPGIALALVWAAAREIEVLQDHMVTLGRRRAIEGVVHLLLELQARLRESGRDADTFRLPISQVHLGDALGLSTVHVNRTLRRLREQRIIDVEDRHVCILDLARAMELSEFDGNPPEISTPHQRFAARAS